MNEGTQVVLMTLLSHRTICHINAIDMHKTPRYHETDSTEPHANDGYTNNSMTLLHKNTIILNIKYEEEWNLFQIYSLQINLPINQKSLLHINHHLFTIYYL